MKKLITIFGILIVSNQVKSQCSSFTITSPSGSYSLGCNPSLLSLNMVNTSTVPIYDYTIVNSRGVSFAGSSSNTFTYNFSLPGTYTISSGSSCSVTHTITVYPNAMAPTVTVSPTTASITCNGSPVTFSAGCTTTNVTGVWYNDYAYPVNYYCFTGPNSEVPLSQPGSAITCTVGSVGSFVAIFEDNLTGCINISQQVTVASPTIVPSMGVYAAPNAYLPCANNSVTLSICSSGTLAPTGFTWVPIASPSNSVTPTNGSLIVTTPGYYMAEFHDGSFCLASSMVYVGTNTVTQVINVSSNTVVCKGTSANLTASGTMSYSWSTAATTNTVNVLPNTTTTYTVTGISGVCTGSAVVTVSVDNTCSDVWPGDASSDGVANTLDVLEIGLQSGYTGPARSYTSIAWSPYFASNWAGTISNGKNRCHADCDGDGMVTSSDVNAITTNWGMTHTFKLEEQQTTNPDLNIVPDQPAVQIGKWGTASVFLGDVSNPVNLYGLAFDFNYDNTLIETDSVYIEYISSFLNAGGSNIEFQKNVFANGGLYCVSTRTDHGDVNGNSQIAILHFKAISTLSNNAVLNLSINNVNKSNANSNFSGLTGSAATVTISASAIGIHELNKASETIFTYPNPSSDQIHVFTKGVDLNGSTVEIINVFGEIVLRDSFKQKMNISALSNGCYVIKVYSPDGLFQSRFVKQ